MLRSGKSSKEFSDFSERTTNNKMELRAVNLGLAQLKKPCVVTVRTDSQIVCNAIANLDKRKEGGWKTKTGARCANIEILEEMYRLKHEGNHVLLYEYVPGHNGDPDNERCDFLAKEQIRLHTR